MNAFRKISSVICIIITLFLLSGCVERPFLAKDGNYTIVTISSDETEHSTPIQLTWNSNFAVVQKLLVEASLVLGDLHTYPLASLEPTTTVSSDSQIELINETVLDETILLEATFQDKKPFELSIDNKTQTLDISSVQIEVIGNHQGKVILNGEMVFLGIPNPNLESAFKEFLEMQNKTSEITEEITEEVTDEATDEVTDEVSDEVAEEVSEEISKEIKE